MSQSDDQSATHVGLLHGQVTVDGNLSEVWWERNHWKTKQKKKQKKKGGVSKCTALKSDPPALRTGNDKFRISFSHVHVVRRRRSSSNNGYPSKSSRWNKSLQCLTKWGGIKNVKKSGGLLNIVGDFRVLVATVGVWKKWDLRFGKVWKKYGIFFSVVAADPVSVKNNRPLFAFTKKNFKNWISQRENSIGINAKMRFLAQTKGRRERERKGERRKGKGNWKWSFGRNGKKSQTPQPGIEPGTPANAADALPLSHRDKRHHQLVCSKFYPFCLHFTA